MSYFGLNILRREQQLPFLPCSGKLRRTRAVVQAPQGDGRPCPTQMQQWKPCLMKPCYSWRYSLWSECKSEVGPRLEGTFWIDFLPAKTHFLGFQGARCGEGLRFRNISCFVSDGSDLQGSLVDDELCGEQEPVVDGDTEILLQESCTVPCPGKNQL